MAESGGARWRLVAALLLFCTPTHSENEVQNTSLCYDFHRTGIFSGRKLNVHFLLFTSKNPTCGQLLESNTTDSIRNSHFNSTLSTKILIHGFRAMGTKPSWIDGLTDAFLHVAEVNVVIVDWLSGSTAQYFNAVENMTSLGLKVTAFIQQLLALGASESSIHIVGVSLGAHVGGLVGHFFGGKLGRITGLDPAAFKFTKASAEERLDPGDALFVEAIHTDADNFGIIIPVGHIDYYLNGGKDQPGCPSVRQFYSYLICDHMRAVQAYISSLVNSCPLMGFPCSSFQNFIAGDCLDCSDGLLQTCPRIGLMERGGVPMEELASSTSVFLMTAPRAPFCLSHSAVEVRLQERRSDNTRIEVTFTSEKSSSTIQVKIPKNSRVGRGVFGHSGPLCQLHTVVLSFVGRNLLTSLWKSQEKEVIGASFCASQLPVQASEMAYCLSHNLSMTENTPVTLGLDLTTLCE